MSFLTTALVHNNEIANPDDFNNGFQSAYDTVKQLLQVNGKQKNNFNYFIGGEVEKSVSDNTLTLTIYPFIGYNYADPSTIVSSENLTVNITLTSEQKFYEIGVRVVAEDTDREIRKVIDYDNDGAITDTSLETKRTYAVVATPVESTGSSVSKLDPIYIKLCEVVCSTTEITIKQLPFATSSDFDKGKIEGNDYSGIWNINPQNITIRLNTIFELESFIRDSISDLNTDINNRLPLSGGTLESDTADTPLYLSSKKEGTTTCWLGFKVGSTVVGHIGADSNGLLAYRKNARYRILDENNYDNYASPKAGSSNLITCSQGEFGSIITKSASDYLGKSENAVSATKATQDASGNTITSTYETKTTAAKRYTTNMVDLGFTQGSTVDVVTFLETIRQKFEYGSIIVFGWGDAHAAYITDGTNKTDLISGYTLFLGLNSLDTSSGTWISSGALLVGSSVYNKVYQLSATVSGTAGTVSSKSVKEISFVGHTHDYLPLSGGTLTGALKMSLNSEISSSDGQGLLAYLDSSNLWTGAGFACTCVGAIGTPTIIRSGGDNLYHFNNAKNTRYTILDTNNYSSYASPKAGSSNLTTCSQGEFGSIITKSASDYLGKSENAVSATSAKNSPDYIYGVESTSSVTNANIDVTFSVIQKPAIYLYGKSISEAIGKIIFKNTTSSAVNLAFFDKNLSGTVISIAANSSYTYYTYDGGSVTKLSDTPILFILAPIS